MSDFHHACLLFLLTLPVTVLTCRNTITPKADAIVQKLTSLKKKVMNSSSTEMLNVTESEGPESGVVHNSYEEYRESLITFND